eukprot:1251013-Amphidinium_carterae.1
MSCSGSPEEGECVVRADPRGMVCEYGGLCDSHGRCQNIVCWKHAQVFRDHDDIVLQVWCNGHPGERPGKNVKPTLRCGHCHSKRNLFKCRWPQCRQFACHDCHALRHGPPALH